MKKSIIVTTMAIGMSIASMAHANPQTRKEMCYNAEVFATEVMVHRQQGVSEQAHLASGIYDENGIAVNIIRGAYERPLEFDLPEKRMAVAIYAAEVRRECLSNGIDRFDILR